MVAVLVGTVVHAVACIIKRPFEFGNLSRIHTFCCAGISGLLSFPLVFAALLMPLRTGLNRFMPRASQRVHAIVAGLGLLGLVGIWIGVRYFSAVELPAYCHGYFWHSLFWVIFVIAVVASFFWPLAGESSVQSHSARDGAA
jgi:hypothetical protein